MAHDSQDYREALKNQIRDEYGRLTYTYTCHNKDAAFYAIGEKAISWLQLVLSVVSTCSVMSLLVSDGKVQLWIAVVASAVLALISAFDKEKNFTAKANSHTEAANQIWLIREKYISLITDFDILTDQDVRQARDALLLETSGVYSSTPKTTPRAYRATRVALKNDEEQFFTDDELDKLLPKALRLG
ncbi:Uncharacterised protein [Slackia heliotrinireducens]|uniref:SMODS and SLOG-associating 2TM effector domain-containing protein n=1 Tax=Slackia heliotrinireducens (strain ATCC 29202 / DSM 20476 / NCTC 11029 / RHS 1) TaxID=471855 RepID=C7N251_SLAHD|nr:SLATT domain-containing protein [Slackia heliotrinireducens]ACV21357.1 hypothetical protein Shel_02890 [Slackia heliotrinireducens DSM 20476]VEG98790.1 Uncharacterised protein [Slackia heliotrinireducens]